MSEGGAQARLDTLTALVHGDLSLAPGLVYDTRAHARALGLEVRDERPIVALSPEPGATWLGLVPALREVRLPEAVLEGLDAVRAALHAGSAHRARETPPEWAFHPLVVGPNPIPECAEDLIGPPGEEGWPLWTMCPGRSAEDRRLAFDPERTGAQLLPGTETLPGPHRTTVRHGARLMRVVGAATEAMLEALAQERAQVTGMRERAALARLAGRGIAVAGRTEIDAATTRWAVAGVSPTLAAGIRTCTRSALAMLDGAPRAVRAVVREIHAHYGLERHAQEEAAEHLILIPGALDDPALARSARALSEQGRRWSLLWAGVGGWIHAGGQGGAPCPWCVSTALRSGPMAAFADAGARAGHTPAYTVRRALGRAMARALADVAGRGTLTALGDEPDGAAEVEWVAPDPLCAACGRPSMDTPRARAQTLRAAELEAERERVAPAEGCAALMRAHASGQGTWTGRYPQRVWRRFDADPSAKALHHVVHGLAWAGWAERAMPSITGGKGASPRQALLSALGETAEVTGVREAARTRAGMRWTSEAALAREGEDALGPDHLARFSARQVREGTPVGLVMRAERAAPSPYGPGGRETNAWWMRARDLESDAAVWVPAAAALLAPPAPPDGAQAPPAWLVGTNYGLASAYTRTEALTRGLLECIERDAKAWWWMLRRVGARISWRGWQIPWLERAPAAFARAGRRVHAIDITTTALARTVLVASALEQARDNGAVEWIASTGCELTLADALVSAATENAQCLPSAPRGRAHPGSDAACATVRAWDALGAKPPAWMEGRGPPVRGYATRGKTRQDAAWRYARARRAARDAGAERLLGVDLTVAGTGLATVRVLAPGLRSALLEKAPGRYDRRWPWLGTEESPRAENALPDVGPVQ